MKRFLLAIVIVLTALDYAQGQISVGVRDNRHIFGEYLLKGKYQFRLEQSVYSEKIGFQSLRADVGYTSSIAGLRYYGGAYFGSVYNRSYCIAGANINLEYTFFDRLIINGRLNPHYDSTVKYKTCFLAGAGIIITKHIDFLAAYSTIPEYRMSENRIRAGFSFQVSNLEVQPIVSVSVKGNDKAKTIRTLFCFKYSF